MIADHATEARFTAELRYAEEYEPFDLAAEAVGYAAEALLPLGSPRKSLDLTGSRETELPAASYTFVATVGAGADYAAARFVAEAGDGGQFTARLVERYRFAVALLGEAFDEESYRRDEAGALELAAKLSERERETAVEVVELDGTFGGRRVALLLDGDVYRRTA